MASDAWNRDNIGISLESGIHGPQNVIHVEAVHILIHQENAVSYTHLDVYKRQTMSVWGTVIHKKSG